MLYLLALIAWTASSSSIAEDPPARIKDYGLRDYVSVSRSLPHAEDAPWKLICKLPYNCQFQPWIELEAESGQIVSFGSTNPLVQVLTPIESFTTRFGVQSTEAVHWVSGEGASYTIPAGVTVRAVKFRETGYDTSFAGSFECNDEDFNVLWKKAARTAYLCMRESFLDCPDRERVAFWGDGSAQLSQSFYVFDTKVHALCKELVRTKLEPIYYPGQVLQFFGDSGLWFYYMQTGDFESLRAVYEQTRDFLLETYRFGRRKTWFDWGEPGADTAVIETCFYFNCLETLRRIAAELEFDLDLELIDRELEEIRSSFDELFWRNGAYISPDVSEPDDRANAMAVHVGLAAPSKWDEIYENVLSKKRNASCYFDRWVFEALCSMGREEQALLRMAERYRTMISSDFSTLWEHYDRTWASRGVKFDENSSLNHGWNTPALLLSKSIAGIAPTSPGWEQFQVLPKEAFLETLRVTVPTIKGDVSMGVVKTASSYTLDVTAPPASTAIIGIPRGAFRELESVHAGDVTLWDGTYRGGVDGLTWGGEDEDYLLFSVTAGSWSIEGRGALFTGSPKAPPAPRSTARVLDNHDWTASASSPATTYRFTSAEIPIDVSAQYAIDGDHWTGWRDLSNTRYAGQWFQVDMQRVESFTSLVLDNSWALWDSAETLDVSVSLDGESWETAASGVRGSLGITTISFPKQSARFIRVTQTGTDPSFHWSIYELDVRLENDGG